MVNPAGGLMGGRAVRDNLLHGMTPEQIEQAAVQASCELSR